MSYFKLIPFTILSLLLPYLSNTYFKYLLKNKISSTMGLEIDSLELLSGGEIKFKTMKFKKGIYSGSIQITTVKTFSPIYSRGLIKILVENPVLTVDYNTKTTSKSKKKKSKLKKIFSKLYLDIQNGKLKVKKAGHLAQINGISFVSKKFIKRSIKAKTFVYQGNFGTWIGKNIKIQTTKNKADQVNIEFIRLYGPQKEKINAHLQIKHILGDFFEFKTDFFNKNIKLTMKGKINLKHNLLNMNYEFGGNSDFIVILANYYPALKKISSNVDVNFSSKGKIKIQNSKIIFENTNILKNSTLDIAFLASNKVFFPKFKAHLQGFFDLSQKKIKVTSLLNWGLKKDLKLNLTYSSSNFKSNLTLPTSDCQSLLNSTPVALIPHIRKMKLNGNIGLDLNFDFALTNWVIPSNANPTDKQKYQTFAKILGRGCKVTYEPNEIKIAKLKTPLKVTLIDDFNRKITRIMGPSDPYFTPISKMTSHLIGTVLAAEDRRFFNHHGFDWEMIKRALIFNLSKRKIIKGASSISQQLVKNIYLIGNRSLSRKLEEAVLTWRLEQVISKKRIVELYMNILEIGPKMRSIKTAAKVFFHKSPSTLTPIEAAHIALIIPSPRFYYQKFKHPIIPDDWSKRIKKLLWKTYKFGSITKDVFLQEQKKNLVIMDY